MADEWYYAQRGRQHGPVSLEQLRQLVSSGQLTGADLVWRVGMVNWTDVATFAELAGTSTSPSPATPSALSYSSPQIQYYNPTGAVVVYGGFWLRFCAWLIDWIILLIATRAVGLAAGQALRLPMFNFGRLTPMWMLAITAGSLPTLLIGWLYYALMESSTSRATLGKMALGLVVTDLDGRAITFARATGRYFGKWISELILGIGYVMAAFTEKKQALHDLMANTLVVRQALPRYTSRIR